MAVFLRGTVWYMKFAVRGVEVYESTRTTSKREAQRIETQRRAALVKQVVLAGERPVKLHRALKEFLQSRANLASYSNCANRLAAYFSIPDQDLHQVTSAAINQVTQLMLERGQARSTVAVSVNYWNAFIRYCRRQGYSTPNTITPVKGTEGKVRFLSLEEQTALFAAIDPDQDYPSKNPVTDAQKRDNLDLCWVLLHTGARYREIADMTWTQVDFEAGTVFIKRGKGGRDSTLSMTRRLREVLEARKQLETGEWVFSSKVGRHNETHWMQAAVKRAGLSEATGTVTLHTLRHTAAIRWLRAGLSLPEVQQMLGHSSVKSTMVYLNFVPTEVARRAARMIDHQPAPEPCTESV